MKLSIGVEFDGAYRSVGAIVTKPGIGAVFSYDKEWVEGASCWPLSLSIPIGEAEYSDRAIRPYFEGLLPEEYSRSVIARELGVFGHSYLGGGCGLFSVPAMQPILGSFCTAYEARKHTPLTTTTPQKPPAERLNLGANGLRSSHKCDPYAS